MHLIPWDVNTVHSGPFESTGTPMPLNRSIATISDRLSLGTTGLTIRTVLMDLHCMKGTVTAAAT